MKVDDLLMAPYHFLMEMFHSYPKHITENIEHLHWFDGFQVQHWELHHLPGMGISTTMTT